MTEVLTSISTNHYPVLFFLSKQKTTIRGKGLWKFNSSLTKDQNDITEIKKLICDFYTKNESLSSRQLKSEFLNLKVENLLFGIQNMWLKKMATINKF